ncbi:VOC family protein [Pseudooceanicola nanhaiensis]|uniref:VOC family protein n=1 Tax=Pseudooceanicola nanhaiensis TaxID=375761 RepID=UPI001CD21128|nr:VOC family protein [Pseudooceanicola nanhaiensis]MCA0920589.1 glyoxalase [Pseudooceanicola nanhaiensis]
MILDMHHVQLAMPQGQEPAARAFYGDVLGLAEVAKPAPLGARGGVWFEQGALRLHLGVETPFNPARKAHPAFRVASLPAMVERLDDRDVKWRMDVDLPGLRRVYVDDPFGNRIELLETDPDGADED